MLTLSGITAFIAVCILFALLLWIAASVLIRIVRALVATGLLKGFEQSSLVLALGITALLFGDTLDQVVRATGEILVQIFRITSTAVAQGMTRGRWFQEETFSENLERLERSATSGLYSIPVASLLICLAAFVVLAGMIDSGPQAGVKAPGSLVRLRSWYGNLDRISRNRVVLGSTLALGAYLSLAAIVAIPWLESVGKDGQETPNELRQRLESERMTAQTFDARWPRELNVKAAADAIDLLENGGPTVTANAPVAPAPAPTATSSASPEPAPAREDDFIGPPAPAPEPAPSAQPAGPVPAPARPARAALPKPSDLVLSQATTLRANLSDAQKRWVDARDQYGVLSTSALQQALEAYERYRDADLTDRERQLFIDSLVRWYRDTLARFEFQLGWYKRDLEAYVDQVASWARAAPTNAALGSPVYLPRPVVDNFSIAVRTLGTGENAVPSPRDVTGLGIFGFIANWLVRTRSFPLALISGMIGFGLFGSAVSRAVAGFTKTKSGNAEQQPHANPFDLLLVGASAAVIVFLASQGGLAVLSAGTHHPNPYVLFLGCFLGAVFGERVWDVARVRFYSALEQGDGGPPSTRATGSPPQPTPAETEPDPSGATPGATAPAPLSHELASEPASKR